MLAFFIIDGVFKIHDGWMLNDYPITPRETINDFTLC